MIDQAANAALAGALVIHVFAAIISFLAAFFLIRYKLSAAKREERNFEAAVANGQGGVGTVSSSSVWSSNSHGEQIGLFRRGQLLTHLLSHCHSSCLGLSAVRFVLAITGMMCFVWLPLPLNSSIFASACCTTCVVPGVAAIFWPSGSMH